MVCLNLRIKENRDLLNKYKKLVGSEDAAYYLLAMNNGYPLDATPQGETSDLYLMLLSENNGDEKQAVLSKSLVYMPQFIEQHGDWTQDSKINNGSLDRNGEPSITMIQEACDNSSIQQILGEESNVSKVLQFVETQNIPWRQIAIDESIEDVRQAYVNQYIAEGTMPLENPQALDIYGMKVDARIKWDEQKAKECMTAMQSHFAKVFKLKKITNEDGSYYYKYTGEDPKQKLRVHFVNQLSSEEWTDEEGVKHQGAFVDQDTANALCGIIYIAMEDGDATTVVHELAHRYVRMFWDSDVVQEALLAVDQRYKKFGRKSDSRTVEEALIDHIVNSVDGKWTNKNKALDSIRTFWTKFNIMIKDLIGRPLHESRNANQNALDIISTYFSINKDLSDAKQELLYYEKYSGTVFQTNNDLKTAFYRIEEVLQAKLASEKAKPVPDNQQIYVIQQQLQSIKQRNADEEADVVETITDFLNRASQDANITIQKLNSILAGGQAAISALDVADFMSIKTDIINYYRNVLSLNNNNIYSIVINNSNVISAINPGLKKVIDNIDQAFNSAARVYDIVLGQYTDYIIDIYSDYLVDVGDADRFKINAKLWAHNQINNGESNPLEQFFGPASSATSPIVRLVEYITTEANRDVFQRALVKGNELKKAYTEALNAQEHSLKTKLSPQNFMRQFCELDSDGMPTGFFVSRYNKGQFNKNRDKKLAELVDKYNVDIDPESQEFIFADRTQYVNFYTDYYRWLCGEANLRYTVDYYTERLRYLSKPTIDAVSQLDERINTLLDKCTDPTIGVPIIHNLDKSEQLLLKYLQQQRQDLSNPYIIEQDQQGNITSLKEKVGDQLIIAEELSAWYYYQAQYIKHQPNVSKFKAAEQEVINKYGQNSPEHIQFREQYSYEAVNPALYDLISHTDVPDFVRNLQNRRNKIISSVKRKGFYTPHLEQLNDEAWAELKKIDQQIADYWKTHQKQVVQGQYKFDDVFFNDEYMTYSNGQLINTTYIRTLYNAAVIRSQRDPNAMADFYDKYYFIDEKGKQRPLTVFSFSNPLTDVQQKYHLSRKVTQYNSPFTEVDINSPWVNKQYVIGGEHIQLKDKYKNPQYDKLTSSTNSADIALGKVYKLLIDTMEEAYKMMPNLNPENKYRLPQMRDRDAHLLFRRGIKNGIIAGTFGFDTFNFTERDTRYNEDMTTRPDGTVVETIPQRWIQPLDDPTMVCTDVIGTVALFYEMACNFQNKAKIAPMFQALLTQVSGGIEGQADSNFLHQAYRLKKYIQMYVYGRTRTGFKGGKMSNTERKLSSITDKLASKAHSMLMGHNWRAMLKNAIDSGSTLTQEIMAGKYFTIQDAVFANGIVGSEVFKAMRSIGKTQSKSKLVQLMQYSGVSNSISEIFSRHNETWLRRVFGRFFNMGGYNLIDFTFKGFITAMVYHSTRLVEDPITKQMKFMTKDQAMYAYHKAGLTIKEGKNKWKHAKVTLWDAYEIGPDGNIRVVPQYYDYVRPKVSTNVGYENEAGERESRKIETRIHGVIRERAAIVNGVLDRSSGAAFSQNYLGALVLQMRGWFVSQNFDNFKTGHDFAEFEQNLGRSVTGNEYAREKQPSKYKQAIRYAKKNRNQTEYKMKDENMEFRGQYNFETGTIERGQWKMIGAYRYLPVIRNMLNGWLYLKSKLDSSDYQQKKINKNGLTINETYALRRITVAAGIMTLVCLSTILTAAYVTKYPKKWLPEFLYAVNVAAISERAAQIPIFAPLTALDIVNSVAISKSFIDNLKYSINFFADCISALKDQIFGSDPEEVPDYKLPVTSGSYKDYPVWVRDAAKFSGTIKPELGIDNVLRNINPQGNISSANYYISKVAPTSFLSKSADRTGESNDEDQNQIFY